MSSISVLSAAADLREHLGLGADDVLGPAYVASRIDAAPHDLRKDIAESALELGLALMESKPTLAMAWFEPLKARPAAMYRLSRSAPDHNIACCKAALSLQPSPDAARLRREAVTHAVLSAVLEIEQLCKKNRGGKDSH